MMPAYQWLNDIRSKEKTVDQIIDGAIKRVNESEPKFHSLFYFNEKDVRESAKIAQGPLAGLPLVISEAIEWKGTPLTYGSLLIKDRLSSEDSLEIQTLKKLGIVLLGKGNTSEFGLSYETSNKLCLPALNPIDTELTLGGGSNGAIGAVAAGIVPWALCTDIGGALRVGASCTGLYGLIPTRGLIPLIRKHYLPFTEQMFYRKGPVATSLEDVILLLNALKDKDMCSNDYKPSINNKKLKIGASLDLGFIPVDSAVKEKFDQTVQDFIDKGYDVQPVNINLSRDIIEHFKTIVATDRYLLISRLIENDPRESDEKLNLLSHKTLNWLSLGSSLPAVRYSLALTMQGWIEDHFNTFFKDYDLLLTPALPTAPWIVDHQPTSINGQEIDPYVGLWSFLFPFNMSGHPAIVFPSRNSATLPIGMQLVARPFEEDNLFKALS